MKNSQIASVWLCLYRAKRPMEHPELYRKLPALSPDQCANALHASIRLGYAERIGYRGSYAYQVTPRCAVPAGVQVREVLEAA